MTSDEQIAEGASANHQPSGARGRAASLLPFPAHASVTRHLPPGAVSKRPTARAWGRHAGLFLLTFLTATLSGVMLSADFSQLSEPEIAPPVEWIDYLSYLPAVYLSAVWALIKHAAARPDLLAQGMTFAVALLSILLAHEAGHYIACRRYGVDATLPFFLPAPPLFLAGTFGAFIKIKSPIPNRRALFDIGVAGPLAGFIVIVPIAIAAVLWAQPGPSSVAAGSIIFHEQPLLRLLAGALGVPIETAAISPLFMAAWIGLLVTSLNLLPVGQLDGGHAVFAVLGPRVHWWAGRAAFAVMAASAVLGWTRHHTPSGFLYAILLFIMLRVRHPPAMDEAQPLGATRLLAALLTLIVFLLSFELFPITIT
ncbi:MAG: site-2 protease family protein [Pyrinomonadaceae bacterium]|nr:site-2 protease family protein [Pyrinomonadaceae bacterium]